MAIVFLAVSTTCVSALLYFSSSITHKAFTIAGAITTLLICITMPRYGIFIEIFFLELGTFSLILLGFAVLSDRSESPLIRLLIWILIFVLFIIGLVVYDALTKARAASSEQLQMPMSAHAVCAFASLPTAGLLVFRFSRPRRLENAPDGLQSSNN
jgi:hypothetical protein